MLPALRSKTPQKSLVSVDDDFDLFADDDGRKPTTPNETLIQDICLELLVNGYIRSYVDFFNLVVNQGLGQPLSSYDADTLNRLKSLLTATEDSQRSGDAPSIYESRKNIAQYFESTGHSDLALGYFRDALEVGQQLRDARLVELEATMNLGSAIQNAGRLAEALTYHDNARLLAKDKGIGDLERQCALHAIDVRNKLASQFESSQQQQQLHQQHTSSAASSYAYAHAYPDAIQMYLECLSIIQEHSLDPSTGDDIRYKLGRAYQRIGDLEAAIK
ncbi:hypothetical protein HK102_005431, partial [Quaeritorhiza haematococci]